MVKAGRIFAGLIICVSLAGGAALATGAWQNLFNKHYKPKSGSAIADARCALCHKHKNGSGGLNSYGKLLKKKKIEASSLKAVEGKDPDKDGFTNIVEIKAGTLPGNAASKPKKK